MPHIAAWLMANTLSNVHILKNIQALGVATLTWKKCKHSHFHVCPDSRVGLAGRSCPQAILVDLRGQARREVHRVLVP